MAGLEVRGAPGRGPGVASAAGARGAAAARAQLRAQIAALEGQLSEALVACLPYADGAATAVPRPTAPGRSRGPRVLDLGELERVRDELAARVSLARAELRRRGEHADRARIRLEEMRRTPGRHRFAQVTQAELGHGACGVWQGRPRLGLLGMLMGWWEVKLSSGCPSSGPRVRVRPRPAAAP